MSKEIQEFDDDLDDLDDYLDDFDEEILSKEPGETILNKEDDNNNNSNNKDHPKQGNEIAFNENSGIDDITQLDPEFTKQIENFMNLLDPNNNGNSLNDLLNNSKLNDNKEINFQQSVNETIDRLKNSSQQVEEESTKNMNKEEELLTTLLNSLDIDGENGQDFEGFEDLKGLLGNKGVVGKEGSNEDEEDGDSEDVDKLTNIVMKMLNRLTSKEMMYDSVNSAVENYQAYFENNNSNKEEDEDYQRYKRQLQHLENVKNQFDSKDYKENDERIRDIIDKEMESFNKLLPPPPGVIQDNLADLGLDNVKWNDKEVPQDLEGCVQQ